MEKEKCTKCKVEYGEHEIVCSNCFELRKDILPSNKEKRANIIKEYIETREGKKVRLIRRLERILGFSFFVFYIIIGYLKIEWAIPRTLGHTPGQEYKGFRKSMDIIFIFTMLGCHILSGIDTEIIKNKSRIIRIIQIISIPLIFVIGEAYLKQYIYNLTSRTIIQDKEILFTNIYMTFYYISYCTTVATCILRKKRSIITQECNGRLRLLLNEEIKI